MALPLAWDDSHWPVLGALCRSGSFRRYFPRLLEHFGDLPAILRASRRQLEAVPDLPTRSVNALAERLPTLTPLDPRLALAGTDARCVSWWDADYPAALRATPWPAPLLYVRGSLEGLTQRLTLAIVGTRRASHYGAHATTLFARELAQAGFTIVSGGAWGIDAAAHEAALEAGGRTLAVFGCGIDVAYPASHAPLFDRMAVSGGACLSEFPPGTQPLPEYFPQRNRLVAGLARATLVMEAGERSGALITARLALEANRDVFALPGRVIDPGSAGPHALIRDGAGLLHSPHDLLAACGMVLAPAPVPVEVAAPELEGVEKRVYTALSFDPALVDLLAADLDLSISELTAALVMLELKGLARSLPGNHYVRAVVAR